MISGGGARELFENDPALKQRSALQAVSAVDSAPGRGAAGGVAAPAAAAIRAAAAARWCIDIMKAGGLVVAGTDTPNAINLHGELMAYTMAGMSSFDALKAATVNPAKALGSTPARSRPASSRI